MNRTVSTLLLGLGLLLSACGSQTQTSLPPSPSDTNGSAVDNPSGSVLVTLSGKLVNWRGGTGSLILQDPFSTPTAVLAQTTVSSDGNFALTLPSEATMASHVKKLDLSATAGCTSTVTSSDPNTGLFSTKGFEVQVGGMQRGNAGLGYSPTAFKPSKKGDLAVRFFYADRPMNLQGVSTCTGTTVARESYDLHLLKGWNAVTFEYLEDVPANGGHNYAAYSNINAKAFWVYTATTSTSQ
ncbi:hypothetical protein [Deinococcus sp. UYEF24]